MPLPRYATSDIKRLAEATLAHPSRTFRALLVLRDLLVWPLGLQTSGRLRRESGSNEQRFFIFKVLETHRDELIVGGDPNHLAFRMSVLSRSRPDGERELVLTSVVHCRNIKGRIYLAVIRPFHVVLVRSFLRRADVRGWPSEPPSSLDALP